MRNYLFVYAKHFPSLCLAFPSLLPCFGTILGLSWGRRVIPGAPRGLGRWWRRRILLEGRTIILHILFLSLYSSHPSTEARRTKQGKCLTCFKWVLLYVFEAWLCEWKLWDWTMDWVHESFSSYCLGRRVEKWETLFLAFSFKIRKGGSIWSLCMGLKWWNRSLKWSILLSWVKRNSLFHMLIK